MLSVFKEDTSTGDYSWSVLFLFVFVFMVILYNLFLLYKKSGQKNDEVILKRNLFSSGEFFRHIILSFVLLAVFFYGHSEIAQEEQTLKSNMISVIEENNEISGLTLLSNNDNKILCLEEYEGSIDAVLWRNSENQQQAGLLIGQKDPANGTCRFALKEVEK